MLTLKELKFNRNFWLLFFVLLANFTIPSVLSIVTKDIVDAGIIADAGLVAYVDAALLLASGISALSWSVLANKYSRKWLIIITLGLGGLGMILTGFSTNYFELFIFQIIAGVGFGGVFPLVYSMTLDITPFEDRSKAFGMLNITATLGIGLSMLVSALLVDYINWNTVFLASGLFLLIGTSLACLLVEPQVGRQEKAYEGLTDEQIGQITYRINWTEIKKIAKRRTTIWIIAYFFIINLAINSINFAVPTYFRDDLGFSATSMFLLMLPSVTNIFGSPFWGKKADIAFEQNQQIRVKYTLIFTIIANAFFIIGFLVINLIHTGFSLTLLIIVHVTLLAIGFFIASPSTPLLQSTIGDINTPEIRSTVFSFIQIANVIAASLGSVLMGLFYTLFGSFFWGIILMYLFNLLSFTLLIVPLTRVKTDIKNLEFELGQRTEALKKT